MRKKRVKILKGIAAALFVLLFAFFLVRAIGNGKRNRIEPQGITKSVAGYSFFHGLMRRKHDKSHIQNVSFFTTAPLQGLL